MVQFDRNRIENLSNEELIRIVTNDAEYVLTAVDLARTELAKRGVNMHICTKCGRQYWAMPVLRSDLCPECQRQKILQEGKAKSKELWGATQKKDNWKALSQSIRIEIRVGCPIESSTRVHKSTISGAAVAGPAIGTIGFLIVFLPLWLIIRPPLSTSLCARCEKHYYSGVSFCPNCGQRLVRL